MVSTARRQGWESAKACARPAIFPVMAFSASSLAGRRRQQPPHSAGVRLALPLRNRHVSRHCPESLISRAFSAQCVVSVLRRAAKARPSATPMFSLTLVVCHSMNSRACPDSSMEWSRHNRSTAHRQVVGAVVPEPTDGVAGDPVENSIDAPCHVSPSCGPSHRQGCLQATRSWRLLPRRGDASLSVELSSWPAFHIRFAGTSREQKCRWRAPIFAEGHTGGRP